MSRCEFNMVPKVAEKIKNAIDESYKLYPDLPLVDMIGILETLKLELFLEERIRLEI